MNKNKELLEARFNAVSGIVRFNFIKNNHHTIILQIPNDVENIDEEVMKFINKNSEYIQIDGDKLIYNVKIEEYQEFYLNLKRTAKFFFMFDKRYNFISNKKATFYLVFTFFFYYFRKSP